MPTLCCAIIVLATVSVKATPAEASIDQIYTLPFHDPADINCSFEPYSNCNVPFPGFHYGTDYDVGDNYPTDENLIAAAASGTAMSCASGTGGNVVLIDHGNGHHSIYAHLKDTYPSGSGQSVIRGEIIGKEGNTGTQTTGTHLHFETRHDATSFSCNDLLNGTPADPYAGPYSPGTWMWQDSPADYDDHSPAITSSSGNFKEFVRGDDDKLYERSNGGGWSSRGGCLRSGPGATYWGTSGISVFVRWCDNSLYQLRYGSWSPTHGYSCLRGSPAAASAPGSNRIDVFYRGCSSDTLYHTYSTNGGASWTNAAAVPGVCTKSGPAAVSWTQGRLDVVYRGCSSPSIWHHWQQNGSTWYGENLGGCTMLAPDVASLGSGILTVFARGCGSGGPGEEGLYFNHLQGGWSGWWDLGGCLSSGPGAQEYALHFLDTLYRGCASPPNTAWSTYWNLTWSTVNSGSWPP